MIIHLMNKDILIPTSLLTNFKASRKHLVIKPLGSKAALNQKDLTPPLRGSAQPIPRSKCYEWQRADSQLRQSLQEFVSDYIPAILGIPKLNGISFRSELLK